MKGASAGGVLRGGAAGPLRIGAPSVRPGHAADIYGRESH